MLPYTIQGKPSFCNLFLTSSHFKEAVVLQTELAGVLPVHKGEFQPIQQSALRWSNRLKQAVAVCNSLTMVNKNTVGGVDMERSMFKAVEARFLVCSPWRLQTLKGILQ